MYFSDGNMLNINCDMFRSTSLMSMRLIQFDATGNIMYIDGKKIILHREYDKVVTEKSENRLMKLFKRK